MGFFQAGKLDEECDKAAKVLRGFTGALDLQTVPFDARAY